MSVPRPSCTAPVLAPGEILPPMGAPDPDDVGELTFLIDSLEASREAATSSRPAGAAPSVFAQYIKRIDQGADKSPLAAQINTVAARLLSTMVALPKAPQLVTEVSPNNAMLIRTLQVGRPTGQPGTSTATGVLGANRTVTLDEHNALAGLTRIAMGYRQRLCQEALHAACQILWQEQGLDLDARPYGEVPQVSDANTFRLEHPAALLTDYQRLPLDFAAEHKPEYNIGQPVKPWLRHRAPSHLYLKIRLPASIVGSLDGERLADLIEIAPDYLDKLPVHAVAAWRKVRIARVIDYNLNLLRLELAPATQVSWIPGMRPADQLTAPANIIEQAMRNLALAAETV